MSAEAEADLGFVIERVWNSMPDLAAIPSPKNASGWRALSVGESEVRALATYVGRTHQCGSLAPRAQRFGSERRRSKTPAPAVRRASSQLVFRG